MASPWDFGWQQLFGAAQLLTTIVIAGVTYRSFQKWKREKLEEKRLDIALEALAVAYDTETVFKRIRHIFASAAELATIPKPDGMSDSDFDVRKTFIATLHRVDNEREFFERVAKLRPRLIAVFGRATEPAFEQLWMARNRVIVAAQMLISTPRHSTRDDLRTQLEGAVWDMGLDHEKGGFEVTKHYSFFIAEIERLCKPVIDGKWKG